MQKLAELFNLQTGLLDIFLRLLLASFCGAVLGWEREHRHKPAGLRTHMMVSVGAAGFILLSLNLALSPGGRAAGDAPVVLDHTRVIQGVVTGIGFLGAGAVMQSGGSVTGITTAAGIWVVAGVGMMCGAGACGLALLTTLFSFLILTIVRVPEIRMHQSEQRRSGVERRGGGAASGGKPKDLACDDAGEAPSLRQPPAGSL